jgi:hypothetical protein
MTKPTIQIHNIETGEIVEREMSPAELAKYNESIESTNNMKAELEEKAQAKAIAQGKLSALGLTTDDLRALGL